MSEGVEVMMRFHIGKDKASCNGKRAKIVRVGTDHCHVQVLEGQARGEQKRIRGKKKPERSL